MILLIKRIISTKSKGKLLSLQEKEGWKIVTEHNGEDIPNYSTGPLPIFPLRLPRPPWQTKDPEIKEMSKILWKEFLSLQENPVMEDHWRRKYAYTELPYFASGYHRLSKFFPGLSWAIGAFILYSGIEYFWIPDKKTDVHNDL